MSSVSIPTMAAGPPPSATTASIRPSEVPDTLSLEPGLSTAVMSLTIVNTAITASARRLQFAARGGDHDHRDRAGKRDCMEDRDSERRTSGLKFERGGLFRSHRPVSSASKTVYFKDVQGFLDAAQVVAETFRYLTQAEKETRRSAATNLPVNCMEQTSSTR